MSRCECLVVGDRDLILSGEHRRRARNLFSLSCGRSAENGRGLMFLSRGKRTETHQSARENVASSTLGTRQSVQHPESVSTNTSDPIIEFFYFFNSIIFPLLEDWKVRK